jgi:hypothetical protein
MTHRDAPLRTPIRANDTGFHEIALKPLFSIDSDYEPSGMRSSLRMVIHPTLCIGRFCDCAPGKEPL